MEVAKATQMGPWYVDNYLLVFTRWREELPLDREFDKVYYWFQIHGLPAIAYTINVANRLIERVTAPTAAQICTYNNS